MTRLFVYFLIFSIIFLILTPFTQSVSNEFNNLQEITLEDGHPSNYKKDRQPKEKLEINTNDIDDFRESLNQVPIDSTEIKEEKETKNTLANSRLYSELHLTPLSPSRLQASFLFVDENNELPIDASFELSMTQGRFKNGKPVGLELRVECRQDQYRSVMHTLSGLFCASINFLDVEHSDVYAAGTVSKRMLLQDNTKFESENIKSSTENLISNITNVYYGTLSRETVCTENLTPFKQLMKNRAVSGLGLLLNPLKLFDSDYYSMQVEYHQDLATGEKKLTQRIDVVFDLLRGIEERYLSNWSLSQIFDRIVSHPNPIEDNCHIYLHMKDDLIKYASKISKQWDNQYLESILSTIYSKSIQNDYKQEDNDERVKFLNQIFSINPASDSILFFENEVVYKFNLMDQERLIQDLKFKWINNKLHAPLINSDHDTVSAHRYQAGYGQLEGGLTVTIENHESEDVLIRYFDAIPWMFRIYFHTLEFLVNDSILLEPYSKDFDFFSLKPSIGKTTPSEIEFALRLPPNSKIMIKIQFDKVFLNVHQHPPDGNRGFDLASSIVTYCNLKSDFNCNYQSLSIFNSNPKNRIYTESLLITLPTPDFSMPYNVIMLTSTIIALFFGSLFNVLTQGEDGEESK